jgi:hypothetical protein
VQGAADRILHITDGALSRVGRHTA